MCGEFFYIGITHQSAPLSVRERVATDAARQRALLAELGRLAAGRMILSTCERFEIYAHSPASTSKIRDWPVAVVTRVLPGALNSGLPTTEVAIASPVRAHERCQGLQSLVGQIIDFPPGGRTNVSSALRAEDLGGRSPGTEVPGNARVPSGQTASIRNWLSANGEREIQQLDHEQAPGLALMHAEPSPEHHRWIRTLAEWFDLPAELLAKHVRIEHGSAAAEHLMRVAAGLESRILGEAPILGQVRASFAQANEAGSLDAELSALVRAAIRTGKRVRHETAIADGARSIATLAVDRIAAELGSLRQLHVAVLGSGQLSSEVVADLALRRAAGITIVGRNSARTAELAARFNAQAGSFDALSAIIAEVDAVISCTSAGSYLVDRPCIRRRVHRPLCLVDLCMPRNIDPAVGELPNVSLTSLDEISCARSTRIDAVSAANRIVHEELAELLRWVAQRRAAPAIAEMIAEAQRQRRSGTPVNAKTLHARIVRLKLGAAA